MAEKNTLNIEQDPRTGPARHRDKSRQIMRERRRKIITGRGMGRLLHSRYGFFKWGDKTILRVAGRVPRRIARNCGALGSSGALRHSYRSVAAGNRQARSRRRSVHDAVGLPDGVPLSPAVAGGTLERARHLGQILGPPLFPDCAALLR